MEERYYISFTLQDDCQNVSKNQLLKLPITCDVLIDSFIDFLKGCGYHECCIAECIKDKSYELESENTEV